MKQVITLKRIGAFPEDVQLVPDDDAQKSILVFNIKNTNMILTHIYPLEQVGLCVFSQHLTPKGKIN
jgi:hypothetical protein